MSSETKELRLNYDLCDEEKDYLKIRKQEILRNISNINNLSQVPKSENEVRARWLQFFFNYLDNGFSNDTFIWT